MSAIDLSSLGGRRVLLLSALVFVVSASQAAAAPRWERQPVPTPTVANGQLAAVSCVSATACTAVGSYVNRAGAQLTLAERWEGASWSVQSTPNPVDGARVELQDVSCADPGFCIAVGSYFVNDDTQAALVERWNGTSWSIQHPAKPTGATDSVLNGVSCPSAAACTAVGYYAGRSRAVTWAERWDGLTWSVQSTPSPAGASGQLQDVSCASASACTAVGTSIYGDGGYVALAESWNGTKWTFRPTPNAVGGNLHGVSCTSSTACIAVGRFASGRFGRSVSLAEQWNGSSWSIQSTPALAGDHVNVLGRVSCTSGTACTAVGSRSGEVGTGPPLAERWNGSRWSLQPTANPLPGSSTELSGVSCTSRPVCTAVGSYGPEAGSVVAAPGQSLAERWNGSAGWSIQRTGNRVGGTYTLLGSVSCPSGSSCMAVGSYRRLGSDVPIAGRWDGASWTIQAIPLPAGATSVALSGVSCTSGTSCTAVGSYGTPAGANMPLAERWDGLSWSIQPTPRPAGVTDSTLDNVSCTSATFCTAVGTDGTGTRVERTLAERWNGASWSIQATPGRGVSSDLSGVSCTSKAFCTAVGSYQTRANAFLTLAERWDGSSWSSQPTPNPTRARATDGVLGSVSCTSRTACTAVGSDLFPSGVNEDQYYKSGTVAERWNGSRWSIQPTPDRGVSSILSGVSCTSRTACTAVGSPDIFPGHPFAEAWDGHKWSFQPTPNLKSGGSLVGVSCASASACTAVGNYVTSELFAAPLAERYS